MITSRFLDQKKKYCYKRKYSIFVLEMDNFERIKSLIVKNNWESGEKINISTRLFHDLGLTGDDAVDFFIAFNKEFNVDISNFDLYKYFSKEGGVNLIPLLYRLKLIKQLYGFEEFPISILLKSIEMGVLNEDTIRMK